MFAGPAFQPAMVVTAVEAWFEQFMAALPASTAAALTCVSEQKRWSFLHKRQRTGQGLYQRQCYNAPFPHSSEACCLPCAYK